ncbi:MAG: serine/threonine protein kinase, partial [Planctomycetota bacterium]
MNKQLGRFELHEQIDVGGYTTVYRAVEDLGQGLSRPAAIKALQAWNLDDEEQISRLKREVGMLIEIGDAPNIVSVHGMGIDEELGPWIAMELAGRSLRYSITDKPSEPNHVRSLLRDVLHALQWVHGTTPPILHRDLKPQNILRTGPGIWKVADFGLAKKAGAEETMQLATVKYAAPELLDSTLGEETPRVDIYALGMIAYEMALGKTLFEAQFPSVYDPMRGSKDANSDDRPKWMYWHTSMQMVLPALSELIAGYPQDLSDLIQAMISKSVNDRIASADDALERLGQVSSSAPVEIVDEDDDENKKPSILPKLIGGALAVLVIGAVAAMMWVFLEGRPKILLPKGIQFASTNSVVSVTGSIDNFPEQGRAEIRVRRGGSRTYTVDFDGQGGFSCNVKLTELGIFPATLTVTDSSGRRAASQALELVRSAPEFVSFALKTKPIVPEATVQLRPIGGEAIQLTTNAMGIAATNMPFGEFTFELFHPRYQPIPRSTQQTGIDPEWTKTANLIPRDFSALLADMQREIDRLMGLTKRKTTCPPGPLTEAEEQQVLSSVDRLRQLANGDADIELFLESVGSTKDCDPSSMPAAPPLPQDPGSAGDPSSSDPVGQLDRLLDRVERLIDRKVTCPPGPLSAFEESTLATTLAEIEATSLGDLDIQLYVDSIRRVEDCDPSSRPERPEIPESLRQQLIAAAGGGIGVAGAMGIGGAGSSGAGGKDGYGSDGTSGT